MKNHELREIGLGDRDRACRPQRRHMGIVFAFDFAAARGEAERGRRADQIETFLDRYRNAGERPQFLAARQRLVDLRGGLARAVRQIDDDGVELAVDGAEPAQKVIDGLG